MDDSNRSSDREGESRKYEQVTNGGLSRRALLKATGASAAGAGILSSEFGTVAPAAASDGCTYDGPPTYSGTGMPQYGEWTHSLIGAGGKTLDVFTTPANACTVYLTTDVGGTWRSDDHGQFWYIIHRGGGTRGLAVDPRNEDVVVHAKSDGLWRTTDGGDTWTHVLATEFHPNGTHRERGAVIARKPDNDDVLLAAPHNDNVYRSTDNGQTWSALTDSPGNAHPTEVVWDPTDTSVAYLAAKSEDDSTVGGLWKTTDGGSTWTQLVAGDSGAPAEIAVDPATGALYGLFTSSPYVRRSTDGGSSWSDFTAGANDVEYRTIEVHGDTVYAFTAQSSANMMEVYSLPAGGSSWSTHATVGDADVTETAYFWKNGINSVGGVAFDQSDSSNWYLAGTYAHYKSTDSGQTWTYSSKGIEEMVPFTVVTDPRNDRLHTGIADSKYVRLKNDGTEWDIHVGNDEAGWFHATTHIDVALTNPDHLVATSALYSVWPPDGRIFISDDGGTTWRLSNQDGLGDVIDRQAPRWAGEQLQAPAGVSIDPSDQNHVVAGFGDAGAYRSTDGGDSWTEIGNLGTHFDRNFWAGGEQIALSSDGSIVTAPTISGNEPHYWDPSAGTWNPVGESLAGTGSAWHVAADPHTPGRFLVCVMEDEYGGGVYESTDGGATWTQLYGANGCGYATFDPNNQGRIAIAPNDAAPLVSTDDGATWAQTDSALPAAQEGSRRPLAFSGNNLVVGSGGVSYLWTDVSGSGGSDDTTAPTAPSNLSSPSHTDSSVDLNWDASSDSGSGMSHYNVYVDATLDHQVSAGTTSTTVTGLSSSTTYDFYVTAVDGAGNESSASNTITVTTDAAADATPPAFDSLTATAYSTNDGKKWKNYAEEVEFAFATSDDSGVDRIELSASDGGSTVASDTVQPGSSPVRLTLQSAVKMSGKGSVDVTATVYDGAGNATTCSGTVQDLGSTGTISKSGGDFSCQ